MVEAQDEDFDEFSDEEESSLAGGVRNFDTFDKPHFFTQNQDKPKQAPICDCAKILIIDDDGFNIMALQMMIDGTKLRDKSFASDQANNGVQGLEKMKEKLEKCC